MGGCSLWLSGPRYRRVGAGPFVTIGRRFESDRAAPTFFLLFAPVHGGCASCGPVVKASGVKSEDVGSSPTGARTFLFCSTQEAATNLEDCQFFTEYADPPGLFLRVNRAAFFDDPNMKIGVDAWGIPFKDVADADRILPETYMHGQHRAFIHWLATVSMTSMMGMYEHSSTIVPYAHMLKVGDRSSMGKCLSLASAG